jgi:hypothetical protein
MFGPLDIEGAMTADPDPPPPKPATPPAPKPPGAAATPGEAAAEGASAETITDDERAALAAEASRQEDA